jgi:hypothetical protein
VKDTLQMLLVAGGILLAGLLAYVQIFETDSEATFRIRAIDGVVRHQSGGEVAPAVVGSILGEDDRLETQLGGRVELTLGEHTELTLGGESSLVLKGANSDGVRVELEGGRVKATVRPGGARLSVVAGEREVIAEQARFSVGVGAEGATAVESTEGRVTLIGFGDLSALENGQQVLAVAGEDPELVDIPKSLLLEVEWPNETTREAESRLVGQTQAGAVIWTEIHGKRLKTVADARGRFVLQGIELKQGENPIVLRGRGLLGGESVSEGSLERDSKAPVGAFEVQY